MQYSSTRGMAQKVGAAQAILTGLAPDGGLYIPEELPKLDFAGMEGESYEQVALQVMSAFLPEYDVDFLQKAIAQSYGRNFEGKAGYVQQIDEKLFALELWHGPTCAFKDYALQLMPSLLTEARRLLDDKEETLILVATSGDTGKAALEGYKNCKDIKIAVFYPTDGTSEIQRLQMVTQEGDNVAVFGVQGNFDDAQRGVKAAFGDRELAAKLSGMGRKLSSANSINWGRLLPQIVYYVTSYLHLCTAGHIQYGELVDYCVPTGNFGDILAGYYARKMGLPIGKLICASNQNNILTDFLQTGRYDTRRDFYKTSSPSMDILVSSNLERLLRGETGDAQKVNQWMQQLATTGVYTVDAGTIACIREVFTAGWADEAAVDKEIARMYKEHKYLCDPHTAVAFSVQRNEDLKTGRPVVVVSTASPFKFCGKVLSALGQAVPQDEFAALRALEHAAGHKAPTALTALAELPVRFTEEIAPQQISQIPLVL